MKNKLIQFMQGRYGNDLLNKHLLYTSITIALVSMLFRIPYLNILALVLLVIVYIRAFSKKRYKRASENHKYVLMISPLRKRFARLKTMKTVKYLKCPECKAEMKVPRKKGKITVTCPQCRHKFDAKS